MKKQPMSFEQVTDFGALRRAYQLALRGKSEKNEALAFASAAGKNLYQIKVQLEKGTFQVGQYRSFYVHEPKRRLIMSLPFPDRIVQHSLCDNVVLPVLDKHLISANCANRENKGTKYALWLFKDHLRRAYFEAEDKNNPGYCLKCDISGYFYAIDREILKKKVEKLFWEPRVYNLIRMYIDSSPVPVGLPIGNLISQYMAIFYLSDLDHFIKEKLRIKGYLRYMDDFTLVHQDKEYLRYCLSEIRQFLDKENLKLNPKTQIYNLKNGVDFLGFHHYLTPSGKIILKLRVDSKKRMKRKLKRFAYCYSNGTMSYEKVRNSVSAWIGHARHGHTYNLRKKLFKDFYLIRNIEKQERQGENHED